MTGPCTRRHALRLGGLLAGTAVAGCLDGDDPTTRTTTRTTRTTTATSTSTRTETTSVGPVDEDVAVGEPVTLPDGIDLAVTDAWVQQSVVHLYAGAHYRVSAEPNYQFVFAHVSAAVPLAFSLDVDGDVSPVRREVAGIALDDVHVVGHETEPLLLGWAVPKPLDASEVAVVYEDDDSTVRWTAPDRVAATLADPPAFEVRAFTAPETVEPHEAFDVSVTVENVGGSDGTFRASMGNAAISDQSEFRLDVPADERASYARTYSLSADESPATYELDWGLGSRERTVNVEE